MIRISVNNELIEVTNDSNIIDVLEQLEYTSQKYAVAVNEEFIAKEDYNSTKLNSEDRVDIISPIAGG